MRIGLVQANPTVGDVAGNLALAVDGVRRATAEGADLVVLPELMLPGYPPEDLVLRSDFVHVQRRALEQFAAGVTEGAALVGFVDAGDDLYNAAALCAGGRVVSIHRKRLLPNYGVFDEQRYFTPGGPPTVVELGGVLVGVTVCEDIWFPEGPLPDLVRQGARVIVNLSASPYALGKTDYRERMLATRAADAGCPLAFCNLVGGQDELCFDGRSAVFGRDGELLARGQAFATDLVLCDIDPAPDHATWTRPPHLRYGRRETPADHARVDLELSEPAPNPPEGVDPGPASVEAEVWAALVLGLRDYVGKNRFPGVVIGLSGGIDSAVTATLAVDALGAAAVRGIGMPSGYSSTGSVDDARALAANLEIGFEVAPIAPVLDSFLATLAPLGAGEGPTEENLQARIRGTLLMALSNDTGLMVLTTGNKSEAAVGYSTLYGDTAGGFAILKDVPKTLVYALARWRNRDGEVIPSASITKAPSAELRAGQEDRDSLPDYDELDPVLAGYVEAMAPVARLARLSGPAGEGLDEATVARIVGLVDRAEYKRRQNPPGLKITSLAFGKERRMPITNGFRPADAEAEAEQRSAGEAPPRPATAAT